MTWVSSFSHLQSIFQWKKTSRTHHQPFLGMILLPCISQPSETHPILSYPRGKELAYIWPTNSVPHTGSREECGVHVIPQEYKNKGPAQADTRAQHKVQKRKGSASQAWWFNGAHYWSAHLLTVQIPGEENSNSKEKEIAEQNLSTFKGLGDQ